MLRTFLTSIIYEQKPGGYSAIHTSPLRKAERLPTGTINGKTYRGEAGVYERVRRNRPFRGCADTYNTDAGHTATWSYGAAATCRQEFL